LHGIEIIALVCQIHISATKTFPSESTAMSIE
jgi:hypothetical protein